MQHKELAQLATLRAAVGYLGEKEQGGWWPSSFFAFGSSTFLSPVFPRTQIISQCRGVTAAAARMHDERIGVGHVYHLFRLPEDVEQALHRVMHEEDTAARITQLASDREAAFNFLREQGEKMEKDPIGPTRVASVAGVRDPDNWKVVATTYAHGFDKNAETFPFFADKQ